MYPALCQVNCGRQAQRIAWVRDGQRPLTVIRITDEIT
jgi:hypothetical protein